ITGHLMTVETGGVESGIGSVRHQLYPIEFGESPSLRFREPLFIFDHKLYAIHRSRPDMPILVFDAVPYGFDDSRSVGKRTHPAIPDGFHDKRIAKHDPDT